MTGGSLAEGEVASCLREQCEPWLQNITFARLFYINARNFIQLLGVCFRIACGHVKDHGYGYWKIGRELGDQFPERLGTAGGNAD